jgi:hypothetical protein
MTKIVEFLKLFFANLFKSENKQDEKIVVEKPVEEIHVEKPVEKPINDNIKLDKNEHVLISVLKYVGVKEEGFNKGKMVEEFQKAVDGKASGEPWCMAMVQYCVKEACHAFGLTQAIRSTEHCMTAWRKTASIYKWAYEGDSLINLGGRYSMKKPLPGFCAIYNHVGTDNGHTGIVKEAQGSFLINVEGNTGGVDSIGEINREGDGVYIKKRPLYGTPKMKLVGFIETVF